MPRQAHSNSESSALQHGPLLILWSQPFEMLTNVGRLLGRPVGNLLQTGVQVHFPGSPLKWATRN